MLQTNRWIANPNLLGPPANPSGPVQGFQRIVKGKYMRLYMATIVLLGGLLLAEPLLSVLPGQTRENAGGNLFPTITVQGIGQVKCAPDSALITFTLTSKGESLADVNKENQEKSENLVKLLKKMKMPGMKIKVGGLIVNQRQVFPMGGVGGFAGVGGNIAGGPPTLRFYVNRPFTVQISNQEKEPKALPEQANKLLLTALKFDPGAVSTFPPNGTNVNFDWVMPNGLMVTNGNNNSRNSGINFFRKDLSSLKKEALKLAVKNAMENAKIITSASQNQLGDLLSINTNFQVGENVTAKDAVGNLIVGARVTVKYQLKKGKK